MKRFIAWFNDTAPGGKDSAARADARRRRASVLRVHPSVRRRQWPDRPCSFRKIARAKSRTTQPHRARLHDRAQAQGLLRRAGAQQQGTSTSPAGWIFRQHDPRGAEQHHQARGFLCRQGEVLREVARPTERPSGEGHRADAPGRYRWFQGRTERGELHQHQRRPRARRQRVTCRILSRRARSPRPANYATPGTF